MTTNLVIVESPAKAKTIKKYLGPDFNIVASYGHVRDLLPKEGAVDPEHHFAMRYELIEKNEKHVAAIVSAMKKADALYLATDPDREGEAISWHIYTILKDKKALGKKPVHRIVFHEITKSAVNAAVQHPREISMDLVNAQQARRALDYLVGFNLSPLLWKKIRYGLSAGRVQSPALRMIVEREEEIEKFVSQEYWDLESALEAEKKAFNAKLIIYEGEKLEQFSITNQEQAEAIKARLIKEAKGKLRVAKVEKKQRKRNPASPFITSTLQQEAARKLGFAVQRTMRIAQQLYEGVEIDSGSVGLITYMRTDSVNLAQDAITEIRDLIAERYGKENVPEEARIYKTKAKNAQEAHEAIRPTSVHRLPESLKDFLSPEQFKLYDLIWKRTVASQMISATIDTMTLDMSAGSDQHQFRATGSVVVDPGFMRVYQEGSDDKPEELDNEHLLPQLEEGDEVKLNDIICNQHFTEPPPRYSEATLIKALEEYGIGRPSTYAAIVSTLQTREYVVLENKRFRPTDIGRIVNKFLTKYFTRYVDYLFTAQLEDELDEVSRGEKAWVPLLEEFWDPFKHQVDNIAETVKRKDVTQEQLDESCPLCGKPLSIRLGKRDRFIGCTGYPECTYTRAMEEQPGEASHDAELVEGRSCPDCGGALKIKHGRYGKFIGCSNYPKCKHIESLNKPTDTGVECPECKQGKMVKRQSRKGRIFFSCSRYPDCKYAVWNEPINQSCPKCAWPMLTVKKTKKRGTELVCPRQTCGYVEQVEEITK
ncbi:type I DNA topoisomerase [Aquicella lusitana]|uniref:DNA topoisomerase 1 n=1 Tax=Aquicella lusitana TaxID=254246 RepID=A0A370G5F1_9COXI|nr:type I DNA topoisomerase [Aquicella lusitana]RDI38049.1 DNA topoisomerase I [Aquicella lusitana]VVC72651.1 DNA topoisomerase 1 [Aquicella lusitana]